MESLTKKKDDLVILISRGKSIQSLGAEGTKYGPPLSKPVKGIFPARKLKLKLSVETC